MTWKEAPTPVKILTVILILMIVGWLYAVIEPFIFISTGFGFVWNYKRN